MLRPFLLAKLLFALVLACNVATAAADGLRVGISPDYPPLAFKQEGRVVGIEAESAKALGGLLGQELTLLVAVDQARSAN